MYRVVSSEFGLSWWLQHCCDFCFFFFFLQSSTDKATNFICFKFDFTPPCSWNEFGFYEVTVFLPSVLPVAVLKCVTMVPYQAMAEELEAWTLNSSVIWSETGTGQIICLNLKRYWFKLLIHTLTCGKFSTDEAVDWTLCTEALWCRGPTDQDEAEEPCE